MENNILASLQGLDGEVKAQVLHVAAFEVNSGEL
jgi:hypothetical protein